MTVVYSDSHVRATVRYTSHALKDKVVVETPQRAVRLYSDARNRVKKYKNPIVGGNLLDVCMQPVKDNV